MAARRKERLDTVVAAIAKAGRTARAFALDMEELDRIVEVAGEVEAAPRHLHHPYQQYGR